MCNSDGGDCEEDVKVVREEKYLGQINTFPFSMMIWNCISWITYGVYQRNIYIVLPNVFGYALGMWYTLSTYPLQDPKAKGITDIIVIGGVSTTLTLMIISFLYLEGQAGSNILGSLCVIILVVFYSAPLSVLVEVEFYLQGYQDKEQFVSQSLVVWRELDERRALDCLWDNRK